MTRKGVVTTGFALSAILVLAASCDAAPPRAGKAIAPPKPEATTKAALAPQPESEPQIVVAHPSPRPEPGTGKPSARKTRAARAASHGVDMAQSSRAYHYSNQPGLKSYRPYDDDRPMSGPTDEAGRGRAGGGNCDEACRYRAWFRDYNAWYQAYGRRTAEYPPARLAPDASSASHHDLPRTVYQPGEARALSERDRLDPWHGYDDRDGPQNGY